MNMLRGLFWGLALAYLCAMAGGLARAQTVLTLGIVIGKDSHYGIAASVFAEKLARLTDNRYRAEIFPDGALGDEREMVAGTQLGTIDLAIVSTGPVGIFVPATLITDIPFLFRDYNHARFVLDGPIGHKILAEFPEHGLIALAWGENGFRHITTSSTPVSKPQCLTNLKLRTMQNSVHMHAFRVLGAKPMPMPAPNIYAALQSHVVDGQENPIPVILDLKLFEVQKYLSLTGHVYSPALFIAAPKLWNSLSDSDRAFFIQAAQAAASAMRAAVNRQELAGLEKLRASGMIVIDGIDKNEFQSALAPAYAEYAHIFTQERIDSIRNAQP